MHAAKGQRQQLFTQLAPGNPLEASAKDTAFFSFCSDNGHKCA